LALVILASYPLEFDFARTKTQIGNKIMYCCVGTKYTCGCAKAFRVKDTIKSIFKKPENNEPTEAKVVFQKDKTLDEKALYLKGNPVALTISNI
jgi:hypothetical protein